MIFKCPFDELMKDVGGNDTMDVGTRKVVCEGLFIKCKFKESILL